MHNPQAVARRPGGLVCRFATRRTTEVSSSGKEFEGQSLHRDSGVLDVHFVTRSSVLIDLDYSGSLWERGSSCTKITLGPQAHGCSPCRCLSRTLFVCPIHSVPNSRP